MRLAGHIAPGTTQSGGCAFVDVDLPGTRPVERTSARSKLLDAAVPCLPGQQILGRINELA